MKTLGEIAYEAAGVDSRPWSNQGNLTKERWEFAALAVATALEKAAEDRKTARCERSEVAPLGVMPKVALFCCTDSPDLNPDCFAKVRE